MYLLQVFTLAYILYLNDRCTCVLTHLHTQQYLKCKSTYSHPHKYSQAVMHTHTVHTQTHTSASEDFSMGGLSVSMVT